MAKIFNLPSLVLFSFLFRTIPNDKTEVWNLTISVKIYKTIKKRNFYSHTLEKVAYGQFYTLFSLIFSMLELKYETRVNEIEKIFNIDNKEYKFIYWYIFGKIIRLSDIQTSFEQYYKLVTLTILTVLLLSHDLRLAPVLHMSFLIGKFYWKTFLKLLDKSTIKELLGNSPESYRCRNSLAQCSIILWLWVIVYHVFFLKPHFSSGTLKIVSN